jgi:hypothetical protein
MTQPLTWMINAPGQRNGSFRRKRQMAAIIHKQLFRLDCRWPSEPTSLALLMVSLLARSHRSRPSCFRLRRRRHRDLARLDLITLGSDPRELESDIFAL